METDTMEWWEKGEVLSDDWHAASTWNKNKNTRTSQWIDTTSNNDITGNKLHQVNNINKHTSSCSWKHEYNLTHTVSCYANNFIAAEMQTKTTPIVVSQELHKKMNQICICRGNRKQYSASSKLNTTGQNSTLLCTTQHLALGSADGQPTGANFHLHNS